MIWINKTNRSIKFSKKNVGDSFPFKTNSKPPSTVHYRQRTELVTDIDFFHWLSGKLALNPYQYFSENVSQERTDTENSTALKMLLKLWDQGCLHDLPLFFNKYSKEVIISGKLFLAIPYVFNECPQMIKHLSRLLDLLYVFMQGHLFILSFKYHFNHPICLRWIMNKKLLKMKSSFKIWIPYLWFSKISSFV